MKDSLTRLPDSVKSFGFDIYFRYLFGNVKTSSEGFKVNGVEINRKEYSAIISFIHDTKLAITEAPPKTNELLYFVANKIKETTKSLFRSGLHMPTKQEAEKEINSRLTPKEIRSIMNKEFFVEQARDQMLLENVRRVFFGRKVAKTWGETLKNVLSFGTREKLQPGNDDIVDGIATTDVINGVPKAERSNLKEVLTSMKKSDGLSWNVKGELTLGDGVLKGSNINRIAKYLFNTEQQLHSHKPIGTDTFIAEMLKNQNMISRAKGIRIMKNDNGGFSVVKFGVNVVELTLRIGHILAYLNIPWYGWLAALMQVGAADFSTLASIITAIPKNLTSGTLVEPLGNFLSGAIKVLEMC